ncbi:hypothetical protein SAMN05216251_102554 [Actinacidiphila alni]|uniref:Uncharacterized protein n=1 Tax=Actinacidiphila alni TaxID=380248 RepID=A0A1I1ZUY7_9ACTN|nr:hypothetical protein [Actinacidiphila alni]SFE34360.1 hypothetical protein SAMN05216251_102554 [Actinacidiphila alni]
MADRQFLLNSLSRLRELARSDEERLANAREQVRAAEALVADAEVRVVASSRALEAVETRLDSLVHIPAPRAEEAPVDADKQPLPVVDLIRAYLRERDEATTAEIITHVRRARPQAKPSSINPELTRLVKRRHIVRVTTGVYRLSAEHEAGLLPIL